MSDTARVHAVARSATHQLGKIRQDHIELVAGHGVAGDAHAGATVKHRSRVRRDPTHPNLRQVHLLMAATLDRDASGGLIRKAGVMGVVVQGGTVRPSDPIRVTLPSTPHAPLTPV